MKKWINETPRWLTWGLILPLIILNGWLILQVFQYFRSLVTVFVGANLLAFILDYPVRWLQRQRINRDRAVGIVILLTLSVILVLGVTIVPLVIDQLNELIKRLPSWLESGSQQLQSMQNWAIARRLPIDLNRIALQLQDGVSNRLQLLSGEILGFSVGLIGNALDFSLTLVLTFYLLLQGNKLWNGLFQWFPTEISLRLRQYTHQSFHNYFVGQASLASIIGGLMILAFLILQVPFGLLFGIGIGIMALIPFGAPFSICLVSFLIALNSLWLGIKVLIVGILIDQGVENIVAPRLLGQFTGINPVWILISLLIGVRLGGMLGLLMAVPVAGFIKNMADYWRTQHSQSSLSELN